jgi:putative Ca2+/H+ antiporter (TMEM165/GDT1 family)
MTEWGPASATAFVLIAAAEMGDKSQLVCMALAARHRGLPVLLGAVAAFALLNLAAVLFGAVAARWFPDTLLAVLVAFLFAAYGIHLLRLDETVAAEAVVEKEGQGVFLTTFMMIFIAEFGDKTQIAIAGLSSSAAPAPVWLGSTLALSMTSALGVWAGRTVFRRIPLRLLHRLGGVVFLGLAGYAAARSIPAEYLERLRSSLGIG